MSKAKSLKERIDTLEKNDELNKIGQLLLSYDSETIIEALNIYKIGNPVLLNCLDALFSNLTKFLYLPFEEGPVPLKVLDWSFNKFLESYKLADEKKEFSGALQFFKKFGAILNFSTEVEVENLQIFIDKNTDISFINIFNTPAYIDKNQDKKVKIELFKAILPKDKEPILIKLFLEKLFEVSPLLYIYNSQEEWLENAKLINFLKNNIKALEIENLKSYIEDTLVLTKVINSLASSEITSPNAIKFLTSKINAKKLEGNDLNWIRDKYIEHILTPEEGREDPYAKLNSIFPTLYEANINKVSNQFFVSDLPRPSSRKKMISLTNIDKVIYNNDKFDEGINIEHKNNYIKGKPLQLEDGTPIGYNIHLPDKVIRAIVIDVYGGGEKKTRISDFKAPEKSLDSLRKYLLNKGVAIINLNLLDIIESEVFQEDITQNIHSRLHQSINKFFNEIKNSPQNLGEELTILLNKKIFLMGNSFGGRTAVKHAQLYPKTFDGYISCEGYLIFEKGYQNGKFVDRISKQWASPENGIDEIQDNILIINNFDDHRVKISTAIKWYEKAKEAQKDEFIRVCYPIKGSSGIDGLKGHGFPDINEIFENLAQTVSSFIFNGLSPLSSVSDWRNFKMKILAEKNLDKNFAEEKFISEAFRFYKFTQEGGLLINKKPLDLNEEIWNKYYEPLYYVLKKVSELKNNSSNELYNEIKKLEYEGVLENKDLIDNALKLGFPRVLEIIKENRNGCIDIPDSFSFEKVTNKEALRLKFKSYLQSKKTGFNLQLQLLEDLLKSNFNIINSELYKEFRNKFSEKINIVKENLFQHLKEEGNKIQAVWKQALNKVIECDYMNIFNEENIIQPSEEEVMMEVIGKNEY